MVQLPGNSCYNDGTALIILAIIVLWLAYFLAVILITKKLNTQRKSLKIVIPAAMLIALLLISWILFGIKMESDYMCDWHRPASCIARGGFCVESKSHCLNLSGTTILDGKTFTRNCENYLYDSNGRQQGKGKTPGAVCCLINQ